MGNSRLCGFQVRYTKCAHYCVCVCVGYTTVDSVFGTEAIDQSVLGRAAYACNLRAGRTGTERFQGLSSSQPRLIGEAQGGRVVRNDLRH